jgi:hypothetical protein
MESEVHLMSQYFQERVVPSCDNERFVRIVSGNRRSLNKAVGRAVVMDVDVVYEYPGGTLKERQMID